MTAEATRGPIVSTYAAAGDAEFRVDTYQTAEGRYRCRMTRISSHDKDFAVGEADTPLAALESAWAAYTEKTPL